MKTPSPIIILIFSLAVIYRDFVAFFPKLRGENRKKERPYLKHMASLIYFLDY